MSFPAEILVALKLIFLNPRLFLLYLRKRLVETATRPFLSSVMHGVYVKRIGDICFEIDAESFPGRSDYALQTKWGFYQIAVVDYIKKELRPGGVFIDVGAHAGYISAVAASLVGKGGQVHCFEPVPPTFQYLRKLAVNNPGYQIFLNNCAASDKAGKIKIDYMGSQSSGGSSAVAGLLDANKVKTTFECPALRLDEYIKQRKIRKIDLIKIDVEEYEFPVLKGLRGYFEETRHRPPIICEIGRQGYALLGTTRKDLADYMRQYGYRAYDVMVPGRRVDITKVPVGTDVVWKAGGF